MTGPPSRARRWTDEELIAGVQLIHETVAATDAAVAPLEHHARTLSDRGWTWPVDQVLTFVPKILAAATAEGTLDDAFVALYRAEGGAHFHALAAHLDRSPELRRWRPLLAQCVTAFRRGEYLVVVPALLSVYEGALAAVVDRFDATRPRQLATDELAAADRNLERVVWASIAAFTAALFASHEFGGARPSTLNRHWVLHGRDEPAWTRADCLRLFQAVHTLSAARLVSKQDLGALLRDKTLAGYLNPYPPDAPKA